jgi:AraC-like DNA-binding protein
VGGALAITKVLGQLGFDSDAVLEEAGIEPKLFRDPDNLITYRARGRLMALCVARTGCRHFGLLVGEQMNLQALGLVGLLARNSPDVRTSLSYIVKLLHLHSRGAVTRLMVGDSEAMLTYEALQGHVEGDDQTGDGAVAMMLNIMTSLCGTRFRPIAAHFAHRAPKSAAPFRRFFKVPLRFDAKHFALEFSRHWLDVRLPDSDPELQRLLQKQVSALEAEHRDDFAEQVRRLLRSAVLTGHSGADDVAALFSIHCRTLARKLAACDARFHDLVDEVSFETAQQMLQLTSLDIETIAETLGYARSSAFCRAFRRWSGTTPSSWRKEHAGRQ